MSEQTTTIEQADAFVAKLNRFATTLDAQEQGWLVALLARPAAEEEVQGYQLLPPFSLTVSPQALLPGAPGAESTQARRDSASTSLFNHCATGVHMKDARII